MHKLLVSGLAVVCIGAALSVPSMGWADQSVAGANASGESEEIGEIVVTANKREENINKVPMTITALSANDLAERRITSLEDIAAAVPGLAYAPSTTNTPIFTLRGVGFNESSLGVYPTVSVYIDQAPLSFPVLASHAAFDLERIEVLKGPQGTLFGENSTGGAINYIAARPTQTFEAGTDVGYGTFGAIDASMFASGPITDTLGIRVSAMAHHMDDWQYSVTRDETNGHQNYTAGRILLDWKASDALKVSLNLNGWVDTSQPQAQQLIAVKPEGPPYPGELTSVFSGYSPRSADWTNQALDPSLGVVGPSGATVPGTAKLADFNPYSDRRFYQAALRGDLDLPAGLTLTSLTSYDHFVQEQATNGDGNALVTFDLQGGQGNIESFNQELRLANAATSALKWIVGANYENSTTYENQLLRYFDNSNYNAANLFINASGVTNLQKISNYAGFGNIDYTLTPEITLHAGARYTQSDNRADICSYTTPGGNVDKLFNILGGLLGTVPFTAIGPSGCYTLNANGVPGFPFVKSLDQDNVSWRTGIDYQFNSDTMFYVSASRGYKAGSFPSLAAAKYLTLEPVTQESLTDYEGGVKAQFMDRRLSVNAAIFYYDYANKQIRGKLLDPIFGILDAEVNVPKSSIKGAEGEVTFRPVNALTLSAAVTYLDSKVTNYTGVNLIGQTENFAGDVLPFTPTWSGVLDGEFRFTAPHGAPFVGVSVRGQTSSVAGLGATQVPYNTPTVKAPITVIQPGITCVYCISPYATVDARLGYEGESGKWKVMVWGKNILDKYYWTNVVPANDSAARLAGLPATFGVSFSQKF
jgi:outer membrane receptor protein involved in Fe transport